MCLAEALLRIPDADDRRRADPRTSSPATRMGLGGRGRAAGCSLNAATWGLMLTGTLTAWADERGRRAGDDRAAARRPRRRAVRPRRDPPGDEDHGRAVHRRRDDRRRDRARGAARGARLPLLLRHARRGGAHRARCGALFRRVRGGDRRRRARRAMRAATIEARPGISIKLSALHPRYEVAQQARVLGELAAAARGARRARRAAAGIPVTLDAEESRPARAVARALRAPRARSALAGWDGLGLAVQAYQKRAIHVLRLAGRARARRAAAAHGAPRQGRVLGHRDQAWRRCSASTTTRCSRASRRPTSPTSPARRRCSRPATRIFPQFATHNSHIGRDRARVRRRTPRLRVPEAARHGRRAVRRARARDGHRVPRLRAGRRASRSARLSRAPVARERRQQLVRPPGRRPGRAARAAGGRPDRSAAAAVRAASARAPRRATCFRDRLNSRGVDLVRSRACSRGSRSGVAARSRRGGGGLPARAAITEPADRRRVVGAVRDASAAELDEAVRSAGAAWRRWDATPAEERARALERAADAARGRDGRADLAAACARRARRCPTRSPRCARRSTSAATTRARGRADFGAPHALPGPTGEANSLAARRPRRVRLHQPVELPARDLHRPGHRGAGGGQRGGREAGGADAAHRGARGRAAPRGRRAARGAAARCRRPAKRSAPRSSAIRASPASCSPARTRPRARSTAALAARDGPIVPLIAETGGLNAMIVDSLGAARAGGRRHACLRVPERGPALLALARPARAGGRRAAHPRDARRRDGGAAGRRSRRCPRPTSVRSSTPTPRRCWRHTSRGCARRACRSHAVPLPDARAARDVRRPGRRSRSTLADLPRARGVRAGAARGPLSGDASSSERSTRSRPPATGSRSASTAASSASSSACARGCASATVYVNRNMIGAVVGVQPFGGEGLSGTGPEGRRAALPAALRGRADGDGQHGCGGRERGTARASGLTRWPRQAIPASFMAAARIGFAHSGASSKLRGATMRPERQWSRSLGAGSRPAFGSPSLELS